MTTGIAIVVKGLTYCLSSHRRVVALIVRSNAACFAGTERRAEVSLGTFQPFLFYQLGGGTYLRSAAVMAYNFENDGYSVPLELGIGQVISTSKAVFNFWIEPQVSAADKGAGWPKWQIFFALNTQFK